MLLVIFGVLGVLHLIANATSSAWLEWATKPLLMPVLALWVWTKLGRQGKGIVAALLFSAAGDIVLQTGLFIPGMLLFLCAHICYVTTFARSGYRPKAWAIALYAAILVGGMIWMWEGLGALAIPMAFYGIALASTATLSASVNWRVGLGGGLFLLSDLLIAVDMAEVAKIPGPPIWVMLTYIAAQGLIATGWVYGRRRD